MRLNDDDYDAEQAIGILATLAGAVLFVAILAGSILAIVYLMQG